MITYVIILAEKFPSWHPRAGYPTDFWTNFENALDGETYGKFHTFRGNYQRWRKCFEKINKGEACLSIRVWEGKAYKSPQKEIARLTKKDGIGLQRAQMPLSLNGDQNAIVGKKKIPFKVLADNDGLSLEDWKNWMGLAIGQELAIIHFTKFRY